MYGAGDLMYEIDGIIAVGKVLVCRFAANDGTSRQLQRHLAGR